MSYDAGFAAVLYEQQAGERTFFQEVVPRKVSKSFTRTWKCGFRFPEERVGMRWVVLRCGLSNQLVKPLSLLVERRVTV